GRAERARGRRVGACSNLRCRDRAIPPRRGPRQSRPGRESASATPWAESLSPDQPADEEAQAGCDAEHEPACEKRFDGPLTPGAARPPLVEAASGGQRRCTARQIGALASALLGVEPE